MGERAREDGPWPASSQFRPKATVAPFLAGDAEAAGSFASVPVQAIGLYGSVEVVREGRGREKRKSGWTSGCARTGRWPAWPAFRVVALLPYPSQPSISPNALTQSNKQTRRFNVSAIH